MKSMTLSSTASRSYLFNSPSPTRVEPSLPAKKGIIYQLLKHPLARPYYRLAVGVMILNLFAASVLIQKIPDLNESQLIKVLQFIILFNFGAGIFIRQHWVVNLLFKLATSVPLSAPLSIRWAAAKIYHFGGIHIGAFASGTLWMTFLTSVMLTKRGVSLNPFVMGLNISHCLVLYAMIYVSMPHIRFPKHNLFERVVRFGSWTSLLIFWIQSYLTAASTFNGQGTLLNHWMEELFFWPLIYLTYCVVSPWLHLKKIKVDINTPSNHVALADFNYGVTPFAGSSTELSTSPLLEWHSFANIPLQGREGFKLAISRAGDWTGQLIDSKPKTLWVRAIPTAGVGNIEKLFKKVIWVATGSGIGPCLPHLLSQEVPSRLVWSTRTPEATYGEELVNQIKSVQPDALIWDTVSQGKPDLVQLAYQAYKEFDAEAIICISNQSLTFHLNNELESRGIPCLGAIWDS